jgi:hypothetical protein
MAAKRKRKGIPDSIRFEVFKRDGFKCQYCGRAAPEIVLNCDHIDPHSKGGSDEIVNLITSCRDCNSGKSDTPLDDATAIAKQRAQLDELNERREQLEMMMRWREGMMDLAADEVAAFHRAYKQRLPGWMLNSKGLSDVRKAIKKHGLARCLTGLDKAVDLYPSAGPEPTRDEMDRFWKMFYIFARPDEEQILFRCRGITKKRLRLDYKSNANLLAFYKQLQEWGATQDELLSVATDPDSGSKAGIERARDRMLDRLKERRGI